MSSELRRRRKTANNKTSPFFHRCGRHSPTNMHLSRKLFIQQFDKRATCITPPFARYPPRQYISHCSPYIYIVKHFVTTAANTHHWYVDYLKLDTSQPLPLYSDTFLHQRATHNSLYFFLIVAPGTGTPSLFPRSFQSNAASLWVECELRAKLVKDLNVWSRTLLGLNDRHLIAFVRGGSPPSTIWGKD